MKARARGDRASRSQATMIVELGAAADLWHAADGTAYATIGVEGHRETWPVRSRGFRQHLARSLWRKVGKAANSQALQDGLTTLEGMALFEGPERAVHTRLAEHDGRIYLDLCDTGWRAVEIATTGWRIVDNPPVRFRRAKAMLPLTTPCGGGSVSGLRRFLNISEGDWPLVVAWWLAAYRPSGPYPVLCLHGEQGSAKTTAARVLRSLIDPNDAPVRCEPREPRDLAIAANNGWVLAFDNLSRVPTWLSDALCRLSTGGGFSTRTLYQNDEETIFNAQRPVILNGIEELPTRGDLLDRSLLVNLNPIPDSDRRAERDLWAEFGAIHPAFLGAVLTAVSKAMKNWPNVTMERLPRMADFATWSMAGEHALGLRPGTFMAAYTGNRDTGNELAIESSPVGKAVLDFVTNASQWSGRATDLLSDLEALADEKTVRLRSWPKTPQGLSGVLKRLAPNLRAVGITVDFGKQGRDKARRRCITLTRDQEDVADPTVPAVPGTAKLRYCGNDGDDGGREGDAAGTHGDDDASPREAAAGTHGDDGDVVHPANFGRVKVAI